MSRCSWLLPTGREARILSVASFVYGAGFGSFAAISAIFLTRSVGLNLSEIGIGTALAGMLAVVAALLAGRLADRVGARNVLVVLSVAQAVLFASYSVVYNFASFLVAICALTVADQGARVARNTVIADMAPGRGRAELKAYLRSVSKLGISLGTLFAAVPLYLDTRGAYLAVIFCNSGAAWLTAALVKQLPRKSISPTPSTSPAPQNWVALRDAPYMSVAVLCGLLATYRSLLTIALPLWVATNTDVPPPYVAALFACNTILGIALQVQTSRRADTAEAARRAARIGAYLIFPACAIFAVSAAVPLMLAMLLLALGVVVLTVGELLTSAAAWSLSFELADGRVPGQYQGAFALGMSVETVVGPLLATGLVLGLGGPGWLLAGLLSALLGSTLAVATRWALRTRPAVLTGEVAPFEPTVRLTYAAADATLLTAYAEAATNAAEYGPASTTLRPALRARSTAGPEQAREEACAPSSLQPSRYHWQAGLRSAA
ncbi:MFS transporter [Streptomyces sp. NPDC005500]|uniref:MFS transporter n=1 Tax=Streptomyces sp. NPDC005500 TaxID=3155007 RepID=UPI0033AD7F51